MSMLQNPREVRMEVSEDCPGARPTWLPRGPGSAGGSSRGASTRHWSFGREGPTRASFRNEKFHPSGQGGGGRPEWQRAPIHGRGHPLSILMRGLSRGVGRTGTPDRGGLRAAVRVDRRVSSCLPKGTVGNVSFLSSCVCLISVLTFSGVTFITFEMGRGATAQERA